MAILDDGFTIACDELENPECDLPVYDNSFTRYTRLFQLQLTCGLWLLHPSHTPTLNSTPLKRCAGVAALLTSKPGTDQVKLPDDVVDFSILVFAQIIMFVFNFRQL